MNEVINNRILVIDSDSKLSLELKIFLAGEGYYVNIAKNWEEGTEFINQEFYNLVILDISSSRSNNGPQIIDRIREITPYIEFIVITNFLTMEITAEILNKGAYAYVTKPINYDNLLIVLKKALNRQRVILEKENLLLELTSKNAKLEKINRMRAEALMSYVEINNKLEEEIKSLKGEVNSLLIKAGKPVKYNI